MPNTLAHIGTQGFITHPLLKNSDIKWIYLGCILPDIPWILQRSVQSIGIDINAYDLRLYVIVQSTLLFSILMAFAFAMFSTRYWRVFLILGLNALLHLLLDAMQVKWANGIHLFAPFSWKLINFGLFWPENIFTYVLTFAGIVFFILTWKRSINSKSDLILNSLSRYAGFILFIAVYLVAPLFILHAPENANNHFVHTLRDYENRQRKHIELDRKLFDANSSTIDTFGSEQIQLKGVDIKESAVLSISGKFISPDTIQVSEYHIHNDLLRDGASYLGLAFIILIWIFSVERGLKRISSDG